MKTSLDNTANIPVENMEKLKGKIEKLNRKAAKLGCPPVEVSTGIAIMKTTGKDTYAEYVPVTLTGTAPILSGWRFLGTIDHVDGMNIVNSVPGIEFPVQYLDLDVAATCDHCHTRRYRKESFVVENTDTGQLMQVGRSCLRDFLGHQDPKDILSFLSYLNTIIEDFRDTESEFYGTGGQLLIKNDDLLAVTAACIRIDGWVPRSRASEENSATADSAKYYYFGSGKYYNEFVASRHPTEADTVMAEKAIAWALEQDDSNDYLSNIRKFAQAGYTAPKYFGYTCSIVAAYQRAMEQNELRKKESEGKNNLHFGEIKKRSRNVEVKILFKRWIDSNYGGKIIYKMLTSEGYVLTWFCTADVELEIGETYNLDFTVTKHDEYNGEKQTIVNRAKVL